MNYYFFIFLKNRDKELYYFFKNQVTNIILSMTCDMVINDQFFSLTI